MSELARNLKELREQNGLKQREIAEKLNVTQRAYSFYENGQREPSIENLIKLAELYRMPIDLLVGRYKKI